LKQRSLSLNALCLVAALAAVFLAAPVTVRQPAASEAQAAGRPGIPALAPGLDDAAVGFGRSFLQISGGRSAAPSHIAAVAVGSRLPAVLAAVAVCLATFAMKAGESMARPRLRGPPPS